MHLLHPRDVRCERLASGTRRRRASQRHNNKGVARAPATVHSHTWARSRRETATTALFNDCGSNEPFHRAHPRNALRATGGRTRQHAISPRQVDERPTTRILRLVAHMFTLHLRVATRYRRGRVAYTRGAAYSHLVSCAATSADV